MSEVYGQMTIEQCIWAAEQREETEEERRAREFKEKLDHWRAAGNVPIVLPSSFRAAA